MLNNAVKITTSCKKCIDQAQNIPLVSSIDLAKNQPKKPAINSPTNPPGFPQKCTVPKITPDTIEIYLSGNTFFSVTTTPNRVIISSTNELVKAKSMLIGKTLNKFISLAWLP